MQLFISVLHQILFTVIAVMLVGIIVGGWPPWIYNRNKKKIIKCHIMNIPTMGMEIFYHTCNLKRRFLKFQPISKHDLAVH